MGNMLLLVAPLNPFLLPLSRSDTRSFAVPIEMHPLICDKQLVEECSADDDSCRSHQVTWSVITSIDLVDGFGRARCVRVADFRINIVTSYCGVYAYTMLGGQQVGFGDQASALS
eukprot:3711043-Amphidinium_carterae.1